MNQEKHQVLAKRSWRKLHIAVDEKHYIQGCELTDRFTHDDQMVGLLIKQINIPVGHYMADGAYDENPVYETLSEKFPNADIVIPPRKDAVYYANNHKQRNQNIFEIELEI